MRVFLNGLSMGLWALIVFKIFANPLNPVNLLEGCESNGYYEFDGNIIKCEVINKSELIKRSL